MGLENQVHSRRDFLSSCKNAALPGAVVALLSSLSGSSAEAQQGSPPQGAKGSSAASKKQNPKAEIKEEGSLLNFVQEQAKGLVFGSITTAIGAGVVALYRRRVTMAKLEKADFLEHKILFSVHPELNHGKAPRALMHRTRQRVSPIELFESEGLVDLVHDAAKAATAEDPYLTFKPKIATLIGKSLQNFLAPDGNSGIDSFNSGQATTDVDYYVSLTCEKLPKGYDDADADWKSRSFQVTRIRGMLIPVSYFEEWETSQQLLKERYGDSRQNLFRLRTLNIGYEKHFSSQSPGTTGRVWFPLKIPVENTVAMVEAGLENVIRRGMEDSDSPLSQFFEVTIERALKKQRENSERSSD